MDCNRFIMPPVCFGPVEYYAVMASVPAVTVDTGLRFDKRFKSTHRFEIADTRGRLCLTVPVAKPYGETWAGTAVSPHGEWWSVILTALESAYGRTPFFEFYIDRFSRLFSREAAGMPVTEFCKAADSAVRGALGIDTDVIYAPAGEAPAPMPEVRPVSYWQIWADRFGFIPGLSVLDIIFNIGPESALILRKMV